MNYKDLRKKTILDFTSDSEIIDELVGDPKLFIENLTEQTRAFSLIDYAEYTENKEMAKAGGNVAKVAKDNLEEKLGKPVITKQNNLAYKYVDNEKLIEDEKQAITFARQRLIDML